MADNSELRLIVGLGNPGDKYRRNRHNVGFMAVEELAKRHGLSFTQKQARALVARGRIKGVPVLLALPQTYMNDSGASIGELVRWHKIPLDRLIVVYDELDLPLGTIRIRERGSTAGHNGMKSTNAHLRTEGFPRLRIGIDKPPNGDTISWVIGNFGKDEQTELAQVLKQAADALESWLSEGIERTMNAFNASGTGKKQPKSGPRFVDPPIDSTAPPHEPQPEKKRTQLPGLGGQIQGIRSRLFGSDEGE